MMKKLHIKNLLLWLVIVCTALVAFNSLYGDKSTGKSNFLFSEFVEKLDSNQISSVKIRGNDLEGILVDGSKFKTYLPHYPQLIEYLKNNKVKIEVLPQGSKKGIFISLLLSSTPMLIIVGIWLFFMRQMNGAGGKALGFGKNKAKMLSDKGKKIRFADVAGAQEAKEELLEVVSFLRDPSKFKRIGGDIPKGCLLTGSPGTGKTLLARAVSGEANVPFFSISGSDFVEMFVGVGASRVRDMFEQAKKNSPCIIFIDEIDAVGRHRGVGVGGGNDEREQTLNQLLVEMDGFEKNNGVIVMAATNRPDVLDPALLRPGRFDRHINVPYPDIRGREAILQVHLKKVKHDQNLDILTLARGTPGFSGADLANMVNESALLAAKNNKDIVEVSDLESSKDKILMGSERKSQVLSEKDRLLTAYHEAGHAIVSLHVKDSDPIHKATIIPRGRALGMVVRLPVDDKVSKTREQIESDISVAMGGRIAEEMIFGRDKVTSGASSDIKMATQCARSMVMEWGMSDKVGPIYHSFSNDGYGKTQEVSSEYTSQLIDEEVQNVINQCYKRAEDILTNYKGDLDTLAKELLEKETLTGDEIRTLLSD